MELDRQVYRVVLEVQETQAHQDQLEPPVRRDQLEVQVSRERLVLLDLRALLDLPA